MIFFLLEFPLITRMKSSAPSFLIISSVNPADRSTKPDINFDIGQQKMSKLVKARQMPSIILKNVVFMVQWRNKAENEKKSKQSSSEKYS